jgi:hypothetical protein
MVYDRNGTLLKSWGEGLFTTREHGITVGPDDMVYCTDDAITRFANLRPMVSC